jgi:hypothetical protein
MTRAAAVRAWIAALAAGLTAPAQAGGVPEVVYKDGLLAIQCADAPLARILDQVKAATGMEVIYEGAPASTRLTASIAGQPASLVLPRLLEGTGINYLLVADGVDPRRVATMYVGDRKAGGPSAGTAAPDRRAAGRPPRPALPSAEPEARPIPEVPAAAEPAGDDDDVATANAEPEAVAPAAPTERAPGAHAIMDPFGRPIPANTPGAARGRRLGGGGARARDQ